MANINKIILPNKNTYDFSTANALTLATSGGDSAGTTFNGSSAVKISYDSIGAAAESHTHSQYLTADSDLSTDKLSGIIASSNLPSYVDDVLEYAGKSNFPEKGETSKIYVDTSTNLTYRWSGSTYVEISPSIALGSTETTAFNGKDGAAAYAHAVTNKGSKFDSGFYKITTNSEGHVTAATEVTASDISGLGVEITDTTYNFADDYNDLSNNGATVATVNNAITALTSNITDSSTETSTTFLSTLSESNGKVSATLKSLPNSSTTVAGIVKLGTTSETAALGNHTHTSFSKTLTIYDPNHDAHTSPSGLPLVINGAAATSTETDYTVSKTIGIGFNMPDKYSASLLYDTNGFKLENSSFSGYVDLYASTVHANLNGKADEAGKVTNSLTFSSESTGSAASDSTYNGSSAVTISYSTIGAASSGHTHKYAGSSSVGGAATSANKVNSSLSFSSAGGGTTTAFDGSTDLTISYNSVGAASASHTHNYAGSSSVGGSASTAEQLNHTLSFTNDSTVSSSSGITFDGTTSYSISYNTIGAAAAKTWITASSATTAGWTSDSDSSTKAPTMSFIKYWNGAYSGTTSNLAYCNKGAFGTLATKDSLSYSDVGAAASSHTHYYAGSASVGGTAYKASRLEHTESTSSTDEGGLYWANISGVQGTTVEAYDTPSPSTDDKVWWYILRNKHTNTANDYYTDLAIPFNANSIYYKRINGGGIVNSTTNNGWVKVLDQLNYSSYALPKSGGTLTGDLTITNSSYTSSSTGQGYVKIYEDTEGGNIRIGNPSGTNYAEIDCYNSFRVYSWSTNNSAYIGADMELYNGRWNLQGSGVMCSVATANAETDVGISRKYDSDNGIYNAGAIFFYSHGKTNGNRGIWGVNAAGTESGILSVDQDNIAYMYTLQVSTLLKTNTINATNGNGMLTYHPSNWNYVSSSQWGLGALDSQGVIRSSNSDLIHCRSSSTAYVILDSANCTTYCASASHTHNYAGSSSAGGSANSVANSITFNNGGSGASSGTTFNGSAARTISYNTIGAAASSHSHSVSNISDISIPSTWTSGSATGGSMSTIIGDFKICFGYFSAKAHTSSAVDYSITFSTTFSNNPKVICSPYCGSAASNSYGLWTYVKAVSTTGCTIRLTSNYTSSLNVGINWIAIGI